MKRIAELAPKPGSMEDVRGRYVFGMSVLATTITTRAPFELNT
jgi:hypothetical protein